MDTPIMVTMHKDLSAYSRLLVEDELNGGWRLFPGHQCSDDEIEEYYGLGIKRNVTNDYICSNLNLIYEKLNVMGGWTGYLIYAANCTEKELLKLSKISCPTIPDPNLDVYTAYGSVTKAYNFSNYDEPLRKFPDIMYKTGKAWSKFWFNKKFYRSIIEYDNNPIFAKQQYDEYVSLNYQYFSQDSDTQFFFSYTILNKDYSMVTLKYKKLAEVLADSGSIITIMSISFYLLSFLYYDYFYEKIFIDLFFNDDTSMTAIINEYENVSKDGQSYELSVMNQFSKYFTDTNKNLTEYSGFKKVDENHENKNVMNTENRKSQLAELADKIKLTEFTNKNYIKRLICRCCKERKIESIFNKQLMKYISFEKLMQNNTGRPKNLEQITYKSPSLLEKFDFLSGNQLLYVQNFTTFKTDFGGILTILYFVIVIFLFYVFGQDFFFRKNPKIDYSPIDIYESNNSSEFPNLDLNMPIVIAYSKELSKTTRFFCEGDSTCFDLPVDCTERDLSVYEIKPNSSLIYKCINGKEILRDYYKLGNSEKVVISLNSCSSDTLMKNKYGVKGDPTCTENPDPEKIFRIEYYLNLTYFNVSKSDDFFENRVQHQVKDKPFSSVMSGDYTIKQNVLYDDQNILLPDQKQFIFTTLVDAHYDGTSAFGFRLTLELSGILKITRTYQKLPEMFAQLFSIISIFKIIFHFFHSIVGHYLYFKYLIKYYFIKNDPEYITSIFTPLNSQKYKRTIEVREEDITKNFTFKNYIFATYFNFICKKKYKVQQCKLLITEIEKFISIEEYFKSSNKDGNKYTNYTQGNDENLNNKLEFNHKEIKMNNYVDHVVKINS